MPTHPDAQGVVTRNGPDGFPMHPDVQAARDATYDRILEKAKLTPKQEEKMRAYMDGIPAEHLAGLYGVETAPPYGYGAARDGRTFNGPNDSSGVVGVYKDGTINLAPAGRTSVVLAHELGHHVFDVLVPGTARAEVTKVYAEVKLQYSREVMEGTNTWVAADALGVRPYSMTSIHEFQADIYTAYTYGKIESAAKYDTMAARLDKATGGKFTPAMENAMDASNFRRVS